MNIAIDVQPMYSRSRNRGIGRFAESLLKSLFLLDEVNNYYLINYYGESDAVKRTAAGKNVRELNYYKESAPYLVEVENSDSRQFFFQKTNEIICKYDIDVFHILSPLDQYKVYESNFFSRTKLITTLYDLIPLIFPDLYLKDLNGAINYAHDLEQYVMSDYVVSDSNSAKLDAVKCIGLDEERCAAIYAGVSSDFVCDSNDESNEIELMHRYGIHLPYIICVGGDDFRKNLSRLVEVFCQLPSELSKKYQLVIVCNMSESSRKSLEGIAEKYSCNQQVVITGYVSDEDMIYLLGHAKLAVFPSMYEGFGLPVVEAWQSGVPVLTSNNSSLGEIAGEAAILVDPYSADSIMDGLVYALTEADLQEYVQKGNEAVKKYTWPKVAERLLAVYRHVEQLPKFNLTELDKARIRYKIISQCLREFPRKIRLHKTNAYIMKTTPQLRFLYNISRFVMAKIRQISSFGFKECIKKKFPCLVEWKHFYTYKKNNRYEREDYFNELAIDGLIAEVKSKHGKNGRIAFVSPLPPDKSGIADYSAELLSAFDDEFTIDVYSTDAYYLPGNYQVCSWQELEACAPSYDLIIYQVGNSEFHWYMLELMIKFPGLVVMHDFYLSGLMMWLELMKFKDAEFFQYVLYRSHGEIWDQRPDSLPKIVMNYPMNKVFFDYSYGIIFHSSYGVKHYDDFYLKKKHPPFNIIPLIKKVREDISLDKKARVRNELGIERDAFLVITLGMVSQSKYPELFMESGKMFLKECGHGLFVYVGQWLDNNDLDIDKYERIRTTGYVTRQMYEKYIMAADVAVQMRSYTRGETSAALLDCLSFGLPTIVNDYSTFKDYPDCVVCKLPERPTAEELKDLLLKLYHNKDMRHVYAVNAKKYIQDNHNYKVVKSKYYSCIKKAIENKKNSERTALIEKYSKNISKIEEEMRLRMTLKNL